MDLKELEDQIVFLEDDPISTKPVPEMEKTQPEMMELNRAESIADSIQSEVILETYREVMNHTLTQANKPINFRMNCPISPFIGRMPEIDEIKFAHDDMKIAVIIGKPGSGKRELARKYAQDFKYDNSSSTIWIDSETDESIINSFKELALNIGEDITNKETTTIIKEVMDHFGSRKTLFIFDKTSGNNLLVKNMRRYIKGPMKQKMVKIIINSQQDKWKHSIYKRIYLDFFTVEESIEYLKRNLMSNLEDPDEKFLELTEFLDRSPRALKEAVFYITQQNIVFPKRKYTIADYLNQFKYSQNIPDAVYNRYFDSLDRQNSTNSISSSGSVPLTIDLRNSFPASQNENKIVVEIQLKLPDNVQINTK